MNRYTAHVPLGAGEFGAVVLDTTTGRPVRHGTGFHIDLARKVAALLSLPAGAPVVVHEPVGLVYEARIVDWRWDVMWPVVEWSQSYGPWGPRKGMRGLPGAWQTYPVVTS